MPPAARLPRLAIAQIPMHWEMRENMRAMKHALPIAHADGAALCAFSELALTGFHRRIGEFARPGVSDPAVDEVRATAAALGIAAAFGAPTYGRDGVRFNSHVFVDTDGAVLGTVTKIALTDAEATFFTPGIARSAVNVVGITCSAVICREIEDGAQVVRDLESYGVQVILWPGQMRPDPAEPVQEPPKHVRQAQELARQTAAYVVQTNWPNALNRPEESENTGHSACIAPTGELLFRLPKEGRGVGVFNLGDTAFRWHPSGA